MASIKRASANNTTDAAQGRYAYNDKPANFNNNVPANTPDKKNNAGIFDVKTLIAAGINPVTGLPLKLDSGTNEGFKPHNLKLLRIIDEQDAINRYKWYNLPNGLNQHLLERVLYYRGQGMFFYSDELDQFFFLPYTLDGSIDVYGRFVDVHPVPFNGTVEESKKNTKKALRDWLTGARRHVVYDILLEEPTDEQLLNSCVLLSDYSKQEAQTNIARNVLNGPLLDVMADCIPFMRTALLAGTGVEGVRVNTEDESSNVEAASRSIDRAALTGRKYIPITAALEFQEMTGAPLSKSEEFLLAMQGLDNYRLSTYGIKNGGLFQKKAHMLQEEQDQAGISNSAMQDGLTNRQHFCDIINSIWGLGVWCEISEPQIEADYNGDGLASDNDPDTPSYNGGNDNVQSMG